MTTILRCTCGAELTPATQDAGETVKCPRCGAGVRVPPNAPPLKLQKNRFSEEELNAPFAPIRDEEESTPSSRLPLVTGIAGFAGGVLLTLFAVWMMGPVPALQIADRPIRTNPAPAPATGSTPSVEAKESVSAASIPPATSAVISAAAPAVSTAQPVRVEKEPVVVADVPLTKAPSEELQIPKPKSNPAVPPVAPIAADGIPRTALQFPPRRKFQHPFKIEQTDAGEEYSTFMLQTTGEEFDPRLNAFFLANKVLGKSMETINFAFATGADTWEFLEFHEVQFVVDGEPLEVGESQHSGKTLKSGGVVELITVPVELEAFQQMLQAGTVEVNLGGMEFPLTEEQLEALRDLAAHIPDGETIPGNYVISHPEQ